MVHGSEWEIYRVIFYQESDDIVVAAVGHRRDIYD